MIRFIVRNYGSTRQVQHKGQQIIIAHDKAIETDDIDLVAALQNYKAMYVTDRSPGTPGPSLPPVVPIEDGEDNQNGNNQGENNNDQGENQQQGEDQQQEIAYAAMKVPELQALAKDRQMKVSGLLKPELIKALEDYDAQEVPEEVPAEETVEKEVPV